MREGWHVIRTSTSGAISIQNDNLEIYSLDTGNSESIKIFTDQLMQDNKQIDVLLNNAGVNLSSAGEFKQKVLSVEVLRKTLEINLIGLIDVTERLLPLIKENGQIVNISTGAGSLTEFISARVPSYQISKVAVNMYTKTLAKRLEEKRIIVSSFDPGWVRTDMGGSQAPKLPEKVAEELFQLMISNVESGNFWLEGKKRAW